MTTSNGLYDVLLRDRTSLKDLTAPTRVIAAGFRSLELARAALIAARWRRWTEVGHGGFHYDYSLRFTYRDGAKTVVQLIRGRDLDKIA